MSEYTFIQSAPQYHLFDIIKDVLTNTIDYWQPTLPLHLQTVTDKSIGVP